MGLPQGDRELVQIVDAALANAALRAGARLVCRLGCTQCCHGAFTITELDALRLVAGIEVLHREAARPSAPSIPNMRSSAASSGSLADDISWLLKMRFEVDRLTNSLTDNGAD